MGLLDSAAGHTDKADLIICSIIETIRDQKQPATPSAVASLIGGAPVRDVRRRMIDMTRQWILEVDLLPSGKNGAQLTSLGEELLRRELVGWSPSKREARRREATLASASAGAYRQD
jgi:hypothetical protein